MTKKLKTPAENSMRNQIKNLKIELKNAKDSISKWMNLYNQSETTWDELYKSTAEELRLITDIKELSAATEQARTAQYALEKFLERKIEMQKEFTMCTILWSLTMISANIIGGILVYLLLK